MTRRCLVSRKKDSEIFYEATVIQGTKPVPFSQHPSLPLRSSFLKRPFKPEFDQSESQKVGFCNCYLVEKLEHVTSQTPTPKNQREVARRQWNFRTCLEVFSSWEWRSSKIKIEKCHSEIRKVWTSPIARLVFFPKPYGFWPCDSFLASSHISKARFCFVLFFEPIQTCFCSSLCHL